jgi:hypothetical protein
MSILYNQPKPPNAVGASPRMASVFVCDVYGVSVSGFEVHWVRKFYDTVGPAKAYRTSRMKFQKRRVDAWRRQIALGHQPHLDYIVQRDIPDNEIWEIRCDVYEITPNGYKDIP